MNFNKVKQTKNLNNSNHMQYNKIPLVEILRKLKEPNQLSMKDHKQLKNCAMQKLDTENQMDSNNEQNKSLASVLDHLRNLNMVSEQEYIKHMQYAIHKLKSENFVKN